MKYIMYKDIGITSNDFAYQCKISLNTKRLCYVGRLDPMAKGDMMILTDDDVKDMDTYIGNNKTYRFDIIIGLSTVSGDIASEIVDTCYIDDKDNDTLMNTIEDKISTFIKTYTIQKYHPISSYMYRHGNIRKPLWWYTKNNIQIDSIPQKRVDIHDYTIYTKKYIPVKEFNECVISRLHTIKNSKTREDLKIEKIMNFYNNVDNNIENKGYISVEIEMSVSSGFYIRQFCVDFGEYIGYPCIAMDIHRVTIE